MVKDVLLHIVSAGANIQLKNSFEFLRYYNFTYIPHIN